MGFIFGKPKMQPIQPLPPPVTKEEAEGDLTKRRMPLFDYMLTSAGGLSGLGGKKTKLGE
jgi:hypothetical protein